MQKNQTKQTPKPTKNFEISSFFNTGFIITFTDSVFVVR